MSDGQAQPRRPASARPRSDEPTEGALPPTVEELAAIERQHIEITRQAGAETVDDALIGATLVRAPGRGPGLNYAAHVRWSAAQVDERLEHLARLMREAGEWPVINIADGQVEPADLAERLAAAGWLRVSGERIMWTRHPPTVPHLDPGLRVEAVTPASALECVRLETTNFGLPPDQLGARAERLLRSMEEDGLRAFLVRRAREPIASARLSGGGGGAALSAIGVASRHRRRGYGRLVTAVATRAGLATGHRLVWLSVDEANSGAVATYRGLGFEPAYAWSRWAGPA